MSDAAAALARHFGNAALLAGLAEADLPKTRHIVDGIFLVDGPAASGRRVIFDNGQKK